MKKLLLFLVYFGLAGIVSAKITVTGGGSGSAGATGAAGANGSSTLPLPDGSTTYLQLNASQTFTGSPTLQSPWNAVNGGTWAFRAQSSGAGPYPYPIIVGNGSSNNPSGIGWMNGSISTQAAWQYQGITNRGMWFEIKGKRYIFMNEDTKGVGVGTETPAYAFEVSTAAGAGGFLFAVSSGSSRLFEVLGTSINATLLPIYFSSVTIMNGALSINGLGPAKILGAGEVQIDADGDGVADLVINSTGVTVPNTKSLAFGATIQIPFVPNRYISIASSTYAVDFPTMTDRGLPHFDVQHSSSGNSGTGTMWVPKNIIAGTTPQLDIFNSVVNAADAGNEIYGVAIATVAGGVHIQNPIFQSTVAFTVSGPAGLTKSVKSASGITLNGWNQYVGTGNMEILIKVFKLGGTATNNSWAEGGVISWKQQE